MRVLVCGDRNLTDTDLVYRTLDKLHKEVIIDSIVEGDARGADRIAGYWAKKNKIDLYLYPADWEKYGKAAGPIRNKQMLDEGKPDHVVAFLAEGSRGTANMIAQSLNAGLPVQIVEVEVENNR